MGTRRNSGKKRGAQLPTKNTLRSVNLVDRSLFLGTHGWEVETLTLAWKSDPSGPCFQLVRYSLTLAAAAAAVA